MGYISFYLSFSIFIGITELSTPRVPKLQAITAFIVAAFFAAYLIIGLIALSNEDSVIYLRNAILTEWLTLFSIIAWVFERSIYSIVNNSRRNHMNLVHINTLKKDISNFSQENTLNND